VLLLAPKKANLEFTYSDVNSQLATFSDISNDGNGRYGSGWHKVIISVVPISHIINRYILDIIDFFKIDCEGCEIEVIPSIHSQFIDKNKIRLVGAEVHQTLLNPKKIGDDDALARRRNVTRYRKSA
jgi:FkbM family methyltransferase